MTYMVLFAALSIAISIFSTQVSAADPDPVRDFCVADLSAPSPFQYPHRYPCKHYDNVTADDFVFNGLFNITDPNESFSGVAISFGDADTFPALQTQGLAFARLDIAVGGLVPPHVHPRASEIVFILEGELYGGFVDAGNRGFTKVFRKGEVMLFPRGLIHWQLNVGSKPAMAFAVLNSEKPGFQLIAPSMFGGGMNSTVLEKAFRLDEATVERLVRFFTPIAAVLKGN